ncbi:hydrogenase expression/formation C-terminal domain-containing protein, partial [Bradyrhizobium japonicum]|uniref:hydrogenase expression/formation C-terminal domain-containing protein n=1 Tax=Bradyrhizobium japonicum TaxID=375 RepID=UPI00048061E5
TESYAASALYTTLASLSGALSRIRRARNVWSVQFFNSTDNIILDTVEVGGVPIVALAADEDFQDSAGRVQEILEAYFT